jgi:hypothetical protein
MRCKDCSQVRGHPYKRSHLVALRPTKIKVFIDRPRLAFGLSPHDLIGALPRGR